MIFAITVCIGLSVVSAAYGWHPSSGDFGWDGKVENPFHPFQQQGGPGYDYSTIRVKNKCHKRIRVAMDIKTMRCQEYPGNNSCLSVYTPDEDLWRIHSWYILDPGEQTEAIDTKNRYWYYYAESTDGDTVWSGNETKRIGDKKYQFKQGDIGSPVTNHTQSLTCSN